MPSPPRQYRKKKWVRNCTPSTYAKTSYYRQCLRVDFLRRCVYCLAHELEVSSRARGGFEVEHFNPRSKAKKLANRYDNLLWACPDCNRLKRAVFPGRKAKRRWVDPTREGLLKHLEIVGDQVRAHTPHGEFMIEELRLNGPDQVERRRQRAKDVHGLEVCRRLLAAHVPMFNTQEEREATEEYLRYLEERVNGKPSYRDGHVCPQKRVPGKPSAKKQAPKKGSFLAIKNDLGL